MPFRLSERTSNSKALSTICRFVLRRVSFRALRTKLSLMSMLVLMESLYTILRYFCACLRAGTDTSSTSGCCYGKDLSGPKEERLGDGNSKALHFASEPDSGEKGTRSSNL